MHTKVVILEVLQCLTQSYPEQIDGMCNARLKRICAKQVEPISFVKMLWIHQEVHTLMHVTENHSDSSCLSITYKLLKSVSSPKALS